MRKKNLAPLLLAALLPVSALAAPESYTIDPNHTYPHFAVAHLGGMSTMHGRFDETSGKIVMDRKAGTGSVEITIKAASLTTGHQKRDDHLRSPDFFNVAEFPTVTFKGNQLKFNGENLTQVSGNLTLLGVSKPVTLTVDAFKCGSHPMTKKEMCGADARAQIKRSDFGMKYGIPGVGDELKLTFEVEAYKD